MEGHVRDAGHAQRSMELMGASCSSGTTQPASSRSDDAQMYRFVFGQISRHGIRGRRPIRIGRSLSYGMFHA